MDRTLYGKTRDSVFPAYYGRSGCKGAAEAGAANVTPNHKDIDVKFLVDAIRDYAIILLSPEGRILSWNSGAAQVMGYAAGEAIGRNFSMLYPPEVADSKPAHELQSAGAPGRGAGARWGLRKDGARLWGASVVTALRDDGGAVRGFAKVTRDLTEKRAAEERVQESEEMFRLLVQSVKDYAIFMLNPQGFVVSWNLGAQRIKGYTADEIIGRHFSIFYPEEDIVAGKPEHNLEIARREGVVEDKGWRVRKDGSRFFANVVITAVFDGHGELRGFAKVTRDISEQVRAEEVRRAMFEQREARLRAEEAKRHAENSVREAQETNRAKDEFLMTLSHELRTPLTSILGWARLLPTMNPVEPAFQSAVESISRSAQVQARLLDDVLETSRIISGKLKLNVEPLVIGKVVHDAAASVETAAKAKDITVDLRVAADTGVVIADPTRLQQILWNLLNNAIKFTPAGGAVSLESWRSGDSLRIEVSDTGEGIAPEFLPCIFEPFRQAEQASTRVHGGLGLGLAIVRYLVEAHGGSITASSPGKGKGATFHIEMPLRAQAANDKTRMPRGTKEPSQMPLSGVSVLVIDDDRDSREFVRLVLERSSARVEEAESPQQAFDVVSRAQPDLIVTDIAMPEMDGYEFVRILRSRIAAAPPVIALSAFPRQMARDASLFSAYLTKPIEPEQLIEAVSRIHKAQTAN